MNDRFGEELTLDEILTDEEKAEDAFIRSAPGSNFGPELTLAEALELLHQTNLPPRARFWEINDRQVQDAIAKHETYIEIGDHHFKIEYFARITSTQKFGFGTPMAWVKFSPNGKEPDDTESVDRGSSPTGDASDSDV